MPPRKPTEQHILAGTFKPSRHGDPRVAQADGVAVPPEGLSPEALAFWEEVVPGLIERGLAKAADSYYLGLMCFWYAQERKLLQALSEMDVREPGYAQLQHTAGGAQINFDKIACRFGLTPSDRAKLRIDSKVGSRIKTRQRTQA